MKTRIKVKKGLLPKSKKWYCWHCWGFTKSIKVGNSMKCLVCGRNSFNTGYDCPKCGAESIEADVTCKLDQCKYGEELKEGPIDCNNCFDFGYTGGTLLEISDERFVSSANGSGYEWIETHKCWHCGTEYEFYNSSF